MSRSDVWAEINPALSQAVQPFLNRWDGHQLRDDILRTVNDMLSHFYSKKRIPDGYFAKVLIIDESDGPLIWLIQDFARYPISAGEFEDAFGFAPTDDLHRMNCTKAGSVGHWMCGICETHNHPRFVCGCVRTAEAIV